MIQRAVARSDSFGYAKRLTQFLVIIAAFAILVWAWWRTASTGRKAQGASGASQTKESASRPSVPLWRGGSPQNAEGSVPAAAKRESTDAERKALSGLGLSAQEVLQAQLAMVR